MHLPGTVSLLSAPLVGEVFLSLPTCFLYFGCAALLQIASPYRSTLFAALT